ncbi:MAG: hypothetical protein LLG04_15420, partial [Parachlamydia sp.]|nr:hypothetical protein [Parachlamydia sp.]
LNKKYEGFKTAVKDAERDYQAAQQKYEEAKVVLAKSVPDIASKIDDFDKKKAAIKLAFENYSKNTPNALDNLKEAINEGKISLAAQTPTKKGFESRETAARREERTEKKADRKSEQFQKGSAAPGEIASLRRASYPGAIAPSAQTERPVDIGAARSERTARDETVPSERAPLADAASTKEPHAQATARREGEPTRQATPDAVTTPVGQEAPKAKDAAATAAQLAPQQHEKAAASGSDAGYAVLPPADITPQTLHIQRDEVIKLKQQLQQLTAQIAATPPGGNTGPQPNQRLPIQGEPFHNPQIAPLISKLDGIETQLTQMIQELAPPVPPKPGATTANPNNAQATSTPAGPSVQEKIEKQAERQEKAKNLLLQARDARAQAATIIAQVEAVQRAGQPAADRVAQAAAGGPERAREEPQPQPAPVAEAQSGGGQRGGGQQQGQQQQQQQGQGPQPAKPEARVGASPKTFADGFTGTVETHQWGTTAHLIKTIGGKEFHVTLDFYSAVDDATINEHLQSASKEKIDKMMKEYAVFSQLGKKDFVLESTYSGGTQMRYTDNEAKSKTVDLGNPLGFLKGKIDTYDSKIAKAVTAGEQERATRLESKRVKMNNILQEYQILVLGKNPKTGKLEPKATVLGQGAPAAAAEPKKPPPMAPKPLRSLASFNADFKSKLQREPSFKGHFENSLREKGVSLSPTQLEEITVIYMQLIYATSIKERDEIGKKIRNFAERDQTQARDKMEGALTDAFLKSENDIRDILHYRLASSTSPELIQKIKVSTTFQDYINDHYAGASADKMAKLTIAVSIYHNATSSKDLENKLRSNGIDDPFIILDALMCFEEDVNKLTAEQAAAYVAPSTPLPDRPIHSELSDSYRMLITNSQREKTEIENNAEEARKQLVKAKEDALEIGYIQKIKILSEAQQQQVNQILSACLNLPTADARRQELNKLNSFLDPNVISLLENEHIKPVIEAQAKHQQQLVTLQKATETLNKATRLQEQLGLAAKSSKGPEAQNEFRMMLRYLLQTDEQALKLKQQILSIQGPTPPHLQGRLDELRGDQLKALEAFNAVQR